MSDDGGPAFPILDMLDPNFAEKFAAALDLKPGEKLKLFGPQFTRVDGVTPVVPTADLFRFLPKAAPETLAALGLRKWDKPARDGTCLWLFPSEWYPAIPNGYEIEVIDGRTELFRPGKTDNDMRFGALAYGIRAPSSSAALARKKAP